MARLHIINPGTPAERKRKGAGVAKGKKTKSGGKKNPKKRRRKSNPAPAPNPKKRRRKSNPTPRRRRRRNPSMAGLRGNLMAMLPDLKEIGGFIGLNALMNFAVLRFGSSGALLGGSASPTMGAAWTGRNYAIGLGVTWAAAKFGAPMLKMDARTIFRDGIKSLASRLFWTEGLARSPWLRQTFGAALNVRDDGYGNRWLQLPDGSEISMAGLTTATALGSLVPSGQYDGLVDADAYDDGLDDLDDQDVEGELVAARSIDAGGSMIEGGGRRFQTPPPHEAYRRQFNRYSPWN